MKAHSRLVGAVCCAVCLITLGSSEFMQLTETGLGAQTPANDHRVAKEQIERWMKELSNWGRWGKDDQLGAMNLVTPAKRQEAARLAKIGTTVSLGRDFATEKGPAAPTPFVLNMRIIADPGESGGVAFDRQDIDFHGGTFTHLDALCHVAYDSKIYNGVIFSEAVTQDGGCSKLAVTEMSGGLVMRGVLLDIPRLKGVPYLAPGTHIYREDLEAWERQAGIRVSAGDAIFVRTGRWPAQAKLGPTVSRSGLDASVIPYLKERDVALIGSDATHDIGRVPGFLRPIHRFALVALGAPLIDNADLEAVAETAARLKRWEFLLVATPPRVPRGTGSPINPVAVF